MGFRGGRGGSRGGGNRGGGSRGGRGGSRGGGGSGRQFDQGPPEEVVEFGTFSHECEGQLVVYATIEKVPFFNAPVYLKNITQIGKVDEILGPIRSYIVSIQLSDNYKASSFEKDQKLYIDPRKLLPLDRFLPKPPVPKEAKSKKRKTESSDKGGGFKKFRDDKGRGRGGFGGGNRSFGDKDRGSFGNNRSFGSSGTGFRGRGGGGRGGSSFRGRGGGGRF